MSCGVITVQLMDTGRLPKVTTSQLNDFLINEGRRLLVLDKPGEDFGHYGGRFRDS